MKLYSYWRSSCSWRVRIALHYKGVVFQVQPVNLKPGVAEQTQPAYVEVNRMAQVPTLEFLEGGAMRRISQSLAILEYLEETYPTPALLPVEPFLRARTRQLAEIVNSGIQPFQNTGVLQHVEREFGGDVVAWSQYFIERGLTALEATAAETAGRFLVGDSPTIADVCLVPQLYNARRFELSLDAFPTLRRVEAECAKLPAFRAAHAEAQPDAPAVTQ